MSFTTCCLLQGPLQSYIFSVYGIHQFNQIPLLNNTRNKEELKIVFEEVTLFIF